jgi:hypothetical protein
LRLWFGGGELITYAVDKDANASRIDDVKIDLQRYGIPKIDQFKIVLPPAEGPQEATDVAAARDTTAEAGGDSLSSSERLLSKPAPTKQPSAPRRRSR